MFKLIFYFFILIPGSLYAQIPVLTQHEAYALTSKLDSNQIKQIREMNTGPEEKEKEMRRYLQSFCDRDDALACYVLATTYDKFMSGHGTKKEADSAVKYYRKAADAHLADACYFVYQMYRYQFMNQAVNEYLSLYYLKEAMKYGSVSVKNRCLRDLAGIYYPRKENKGQSDFKQIAANLDSSIYYLSESLMIDSADTWTLDFIGSIYEEKKNYALALHYYLKSSNENSQLQAANWLATGRKIKKDSQKAVMIVKKVLDGLVREYDYTPQTIYQFMGSYNPAVLLNIFHTCYRIIPKSEVGKWYSAAVSCDDYAGLINE